tara:strand:+ start:386 stop:658 length:273 start_codon:yes stop_codon:yes gene_type:complete
MNDLQNFLANLDKLDEINFNKFNSSNFESINKKLEDTLKELKIKVNNNEIDLKNKESKSMFLKLISKIEHIEQKILPKAELLNLFSKSIV